MSESKIQRLKKEFKFYLDHQDELVERYNGKVLAIKGRKVIGFYDSEIEAVQTTMKTEELGTFLVQKCSPGPAEYTVVFQSRVRFSSERGEIPWWHRVLGYLGRFDPRPIAKEVPLPDEPVFEILPDPPPAFLKAPA